VQTTSDELATKGKKMHDLFQSASSSILGKIQLLVSKGIERMRQVAKTYGTAKDYVSSHLLAFLALGKNIIKLRPNNRST
jgi:hypothetical protein